MMKIDMPRMLFVGGMIALVAAFGKGTKDRKTETTAPFSVAVADTSDAEFRRFITPKLQQLQAVVGRPIDPATTWDAISGDGTHGLTGNIAGDVTVWGAAKGAFGDESRCARVFFYHIDGQWLLATRNGYVVTPWKEDIELDKSLPPEVHAGIKRLFPNQIEIPEPK